MYKEEICMLNMIKNTLILLESVNEVLRPQKAKEHGIYGIYGDDFLSRVEEDVLRYYKKGLESEELLNTKLELYVSCVEIVEDLEVIRDLIETISTLKDVSNKSKKMSDKLKKYNITETSKNISIINIKEKIKSVYKIEQYEAVLKNAELSMDAIREQMSDIKKHVEKKRVSDILNSLNVMYSLYGDTEELFKLTGQLLKKEIGNVRNGNPNWQYEVLKDNNNAENNSFIYYLHEEMKFDTGAFMQYYDSLMIIAENADKHKITDTISVMVFVNYKFIMQALICNFNSDDLYVITNLPKRYHEYIERLDNAMQILYGNV